VQLVFFFDGAVERGDTIANPALDASRASISLHRISLPCCCASRSSACHLGRRHAIPDPRDYSLCCGGHTGVLRPYVLVGRCSPTLTSLGCSKRRICYSVHIALISRNRPSSAWWAEKLTGGLSPHPLRACVGWWQRSPVLIHARARPPIERLLVRRSIVLDQATSLGSQCLPLLPEPRYPCSCTESYAVQTSSGSWPVQHQSTTCTIRLEVVQTHFQFNSTTTRSCQVRNPSAFHSQGCLRTTHCSHVGDRNTASSSRPAIFGDILGIISHDASYGNDIRLVFVCPALPLNIFFQVPPNELPTFVSMDDQLLKRGNTTAMSQRR
jgi:hypothetical protein